MTRALKSGFGHDTWLMRPSLFSIPHVRAHPGLTSELRPEKSANRLHRPHNNGDYKCDWSYRHPICTEHPARPNRDMSWTGLHHELSVSTRSLDSIDRDQLRLDQAQIIECGLGRESCCTYKELGFLNSRDCMCSIVAGLSRDSRPATRIVSSSTSGGRLTRGCPLL
jgi:hypothetical protein